ncbi:unnamed protein product, partial [Ectocarpus sp. 13 AM-2016]
MGHGTVVRIRIDPPLANCIYHEPKQPSSIYRGQGCILHLEDCCVAANRRLPLTCTHSWHPCKEDGVLLCAARTHVILPTPPLLLLLGLLLLLLAARRLRLATALLARRCRCLGLSLGFGCTACPSRGRAEEGPYVHGRPGGCCRSPCVRVGGRADQAPARSSRRGIERASSTASKQAGAWASIFRSCGRGGKDGSDFGSRHAVHRFTV